MELFLLSISLCNVSQKGHTYIKKTFTKGSIMEFFWTLRGRKEKKKRCNYSAFSSKFFSTFTSTSFEKNQPPTAIPTNTIQNVSFTEWILGMNVELHLMQDVLMYKLLASHQPNLQLRMLQFQALVYVLRFVRKQLLQIA